MAGLRMGLRWEEATTTDHPTSSREDGIEELHKKTGWMDGGDGSVGLPGSQDLLDLRGLQCPVWPEFKMPERSEPMSVRLVIRAVDWGSCAQWYESVAHSQTWGALPVQQLLPRENHTELKSLSQYWSFKGDLLCFFQYFAPPSLCACLKVLKVKKSKVQRGLSPTEDAAPEAPETTHQWSLPLILWLLETDESSHNSLSCRQNDHSSLWVKADFWCRRQSKKNCQ